VVTFPTVTAHILGQLMRYETEAHPVQFDSLWYGAVADRGAWRFNIPEQIGRSTTTRARQERQTDILGRNSARLSRLHPRSGAATDRSRRLHRRITDERSGSGRCRRTTTPRTSRERGSTSTASDRRWAWAEEHPLRLDPHLLTRQVSAEEFAPRRWRARHPSVALVSWHSTCRCRCVKATSSTDGSRSAGGRKRRMGWSTAGMTGRAVPSWR
jgi:hypothetical protein